jgi:hypothetical protein
MAIYQNRNLGFGENYLDAEHQMHDSYGVIAKNVVVGNGYVQSRTGYELYSEDTTKTGGIPMMLPAYFRDGSKKLVFANADHYYALDLLTHVVTDAWVDLGDYGTEVPNPFGYMKGNIVLFGTGYNGNTPKKWTGSGSISNITTPADTCDLRFYEYFQGTNIALVIGGGTTRDNATKNTSTLYYAPSGDDWTTGGGYIPIGDGDGQNLTGFAQHSNLIAFKENSKYRLDSVYQESTSTYFLRVLEKYDDGGAINHECIVKALNDIVALSNRQGDGIRGFSQVQTKLGGSESKRYSTKITPLLDRINRKYGKYTIRSIVYNDKIYMAVPIGATTNNIVFVGHLNQTTELGEPAWTHFEMPAGSFAVVQDANNQEMFLMGDSNSSKIYKWSNNALSDNGSPITSQFRTKKIDMNNVDIDTNEVIVLAGEMTSLTKIKVTVFVDGRSTTYTIDKEQIYSTSSLLWSHVVGNEVVGHNSEAGGFKKNSFLAFLPLPDDMQDGREIQIDLYSSGVGYWWKLDTLMIGEEANINLNMFPENHWVTAI